jgi:hypothetical protein
MLLQFVHASVYSVKHFGTQLQQWGYLFTEKQAVEIILGMDGYILAWLNSDKCPLVCCLHLIISIYDYQCGVYLNKMFYRLH